MYKRTGPGKAGTYPDPGHYHAIMYNFDVEGGNLKPEHKRFLDNYIIPKITTGWTFIIQGTASRTGSRGYDWQLSVRRSSAVRRYLEENIGQSLFHIAVEHIGKDDPIGKRKEAELDRAVRIYGWPHPNPPPPPIPHPEDPNPQPVPEIVPPINPEPYGPTIEFFIKMTAGLSVGPFVVEGEYQRFLLWDKLHGKAAYFDRKAIGGQLPTPLPGSFTKEGSWNRFVLKRPFRPMKLEDFDGSATIFTSRGVGDDGHTALTIKPFGLGDRRQIVIDPFVTGYTFGFSYHSGSTGTFDIDQDRGVFDRKE